MIEEKRVLFIFTESCYQKIIVDKELELNCLKKSISELLAYAIVFLSPIAKVPQITKILSSKSVEGISLTGHLVDVPLKNFLNLDNCFRVHHFILLFLQFTFESVWRKYFHSHSKLFYYWIVLFVWKGNESFT